MKSRMSAHETIRRAIIGGGRNLNASDAATRVIAALPKLIDAAMVERFIAVMDDLTGTPKDARKPWPSSQARSALGEQP